MSETKHPLAHLGLPLLQHKPVAMSQMSLGNQRPNRAGTRLRGQVWWTPLQKKRSN